MHASASTADFQRLPWPHTSALGQFYSEPKLNHQSPDTDKPFFEKKTEPVRAASPQVSFGPFRLLPTQFLMFEGDQPVPLGSRALEILIVLGTQRAGQQAGIMIVSGPILLSSLPI
jgi:hypothetical protein